MKVSAITIGWAALVAGLGIVHAQSVFTVHKTGTFYHSKSTLGHGYDLLADTARLASESNDLKDLLSNDTTSHNGKWKAGNTTTFVNAPGYPTFNAQTGSADFTLAKIDSIYKAGPVITLQDNPGTGSRHVYIAKIRGTSTYVIVKFLSRIGNDNACNCQYAGSVGFEYWKQATTGVTEIKPLLRAEAQKAVRLARSGSQLTIAPLEKGPALNLLGQVLPIRP